MGTMRLRDVDRVPSPKDVDFDFDDDGICIFKPTAQQYSSGFTELLRLMEDTAGRIQGVVKAIVPSRW